MAIVRKDKPFSHEDRRPAQRAAGWDYYDKGRPDMAMGSWSNSGGIHPADMLNQVFHILHEHGIEFIRAPYSAWAQVNLLLQRYTKKGGGGSNEKMYQENRKTHI